MNRSALNARLLSAAKFVRQDATFADVGTDHAYLPIFLLRSGLICRAVLSDVNSGPLASAKENAINAGVLDKCTLVLCDGAADLSDLGITDYVIAGMGGELIARIVSEARQMKDPAVRLILQPMSRPEVLRRFLLSEGFRIVEERFSSADSKHYVTILAEYCGEAQGCDLLTCHFGTFRAEGTDLSPMLAYLRARKSSLARSIEGKAMGGIAAEEEKLLLEECLRRIEAIELNLGKC